MNHEPFIDVSINGRPVNSAFYQRLVSATITDAPGQEADRVQFKFDDDGNAIPLPALGAIATVRFGFRDGGSQKMGSFRLEKPSIEGGTSGEFITMSGRPVDMRTDIKAPLSEHFDDKTIGDVVKELAGRHGFDAKISPELASIELPYMARINQGTDDFLTRLADRFGAIFTPKDGKFLFLTPGSFSALTISKFECESWSFEIEPRPLFGETEAGWFDRAKGKVEYESHSTGLKGPSKRLRNTFASQAEAKAAAKSEGNRLARATGSGTLKMAGRPDIMADRPIRTVDFRAEANGLWRCASVDHTYDDTYTTSVSIEAPEDGKERE
jgi:hypothetical protein